MDKDRPQPRSRFFLDIKSSLINTEFQSHIYKWFDWKFPKWLKNKTEKLQHKLKGDWVNVLRFTCLVSQWSAANQQPWKILFGFSFFNLWFWMRKYCPVVMKNHHNGRCFLSFRPCISSLPETVTVTANSRSRNSRSSFSPGLFSAAGSKSTLGTSSGAAFTCRQWCLTELTHIIYDLLTHSLSSLTHWLAR